ncbi:MAG: chitobiase/beta-hexosaminidase C-terminal domain-containing protein [Rhodoferax sp.]|nr:chitobiase/beta-hexosaminidase C-terminal domain-containing protein [Rhodoferax sp.]
MNIFMDCLAVRFPLAARALVAVALLLVGTQANASLGGGGVTDTTPPVVTASITGGTSNFPQSVVLSANEPATIYYTVDGSTPSTSSAVFAVSVEVLTTSTLKYFAIDAARNVSAVQSQTYTISYLPPSAPGGLAVRLIAPDRIGLTWRNVADNTGVTDYKVFRDRTLVKAAPVMSFMDSGLAASTAYIYTVVACNGSGACSASSPPLVVTTLAASEPLVVSPQVSAGDEHTVAIKPDGSLWTWGNNWSGQLGDGSPDQEYSKPTPQQVGTGYLAVAAGSRHNIALKIDGSLWAWGSNTEGELGIGTSDFLVHASPVQIGSDFVSVATSFLSNVAIKSDGSLWAWGWSPNKTSSLVQIGKGFASAATGIHHTVALKADGRLWTWGDNSYGQLGDGGSENNRAIPTQIGTGYALVGAGGSHSVALKPDGSLWAWGGNSRGQVGDGSNIQRSLPTRIDSGFRAIAAGRDQSAALKTDGSLWAWGRNTADGFGGQGQLGDGTATDRWSPVPIATGIDSFTANINHTAAIDAQGSLWAWGGNFKGQIGDGSTTDRLSPVMISTGFAPLVPDTNRLALFAGWNLIGNGRSAPLSAVPALADPSKVVSAWKWTPASKKWAFYTPTMSATDLAAYAAARGYDVLETVQAGEGFWVNATTVFSIAHSQGVAISSDAFADKPGQPNGLPVGWSLIAIGDHLTPREFAFRISPAQAVVNAVPPSLTSLWAWDNVTSQWLFYSPNLDNSGELASYIARKNYLDCANRAFDPGIGFWVNKP